MSAFDMFDTGCAGCDGTATKDVTVYDANSGDVAKDVFACDDCADNMNVPSGYSTTVSAL